MQERHEPVADQSDAYRALAQAVAAQARATESLRIKEAVRAQRSRNTAADHMQELVVQRAQIRLPLSLRALAALHPHIARALPLRWSLHLLGALAKVMCGAPRASLDAVARELVAAEVPGLLEHQHGCLRAGQALAHRQDTRACTQNRVIGAPFATVSLMMVISTQRTRKS